MKHYKADKDLVERIRNLRDGQVQHGSVDGRFFVVMTEETYRRLKSNIPIVADFSVG